MAAVTICSDFGTQNIKSVTVPIASPSICCEVMGPDAMILVFWMLSFKPAFSFSSFTFIKRLFRSSLLSVIRVVSSVYLRLLIFLPAILIPAFVSSSLAFCMMYYCGQESLRRNGVAVIVNKRVWNAVLGYNLKNKKMISLHFQGKPLNIMVI